MKSEPSLSGLEMKGMVVVANEETVECLSARGWQDATRVVWQSLPVRSLDLAPCAGLQDLHNGRGELLSCGRFGAP